MTIASPSQPIVPATWPASATKPLRVAIAGERNSGKTSIANRLLGEHLLPTSIVTRTWLPTVVQYGERTQLLLQRRNGRHVTGSLRDMADTPPAGRKLILSVCLQRLKHLRIIDTPGFVGDQNEDRATRSECEKADVILWCTSAIQAWKGTERDQWLSLRRRTRARGILVVTFADLMPHQQDVARVMDRLRAEAKYFGSIVLPADLDQVISSTTQPVRAAIKHSRCVEQLAPGLPALATV